MGDDRVLDLERGLIAAALSQPAQVVAQAAEAGLSAAEFSNRALGAVWTVVDERVAAGQPVNAALVAASLNGQLPGGSQRLAELQVDHLISLSAVPEHVARVRAAAAVRAARAFAAEVDADPALDAAEDPATVAEVVAGLHDRLRSRLHGGGSLGGRTAGAVLDELVLPDIARRAAGEIDTLATGFHDLDEVVSLEPGNLVGVGARPGGGKSMLMLQVASNIAEAGRGVYFASLEMSQLEVARRQLSMVSGVPTELLKRPDRGYTPRHADRVAAAVEKIRGWPFWLEEDTEASTVEAVAAAARHHHRTNRVAAVVVDYFQLVRTASGAGRNEQRREELERIARRLKQLAIELGVVVIVATQFNRQAVDRPPILSDIREAALENDVDVFIGLHTPPVEDGEDRAGGGRLELHVLKNRDGATTTIELAMQAHCSRVSNMGRHS